MILNFFKFILYIWVWLLFPTIFKGKRNIPKGKVIFVCNHTSNIDPILLCMSTWRKQYFLAKKELFSNSFKRGIMKIAHAIPVERGKIDIKAIKMSMKVLSKNKILTIFPEGTRNRTNEDLSEIKAGAGMLAIKTKTPIVPVWIKKKPRLFRINSVKFGKPFTLEEFYDEKLTSEVLSKAGDKIAKNLLENSK